MSDLFNQDARKLDPKQLLSRLEALEREIPENPQPLTELSTRSLKAFRERLQRVTQKLALLDRRIDPIEHHEVYDPSHPVSAADLIAERLLRRPRVRLSHLNRFYGAGVYALYYVGDHPAYALITRTEIPIYVGKAEAADSHAHSAAEQGEKLYDRLVKDHARSLRSVEQYTTELAPDNLDATGLHPLSLEDFECRFLVLASAYAGAVERNLIIHHQPIWNRESKVCIGFGKHGDDAERRANTRSDWDTIHPGRTWATKEGNVPNPRTPRDIQTRILDHCQRKYT